MKLSTKKTRELYSAISEEIMTYRIWAAKQPSITGYRVEKDLFYLTNRVWSNVEKALGLK